MGKGVMTKYNLHPVTSHFHRDSVRGETRKAENRRKAIRRHEDPNPQKNYFATGN